ncbi:alkylation response protein AidB-like acyl-CoA dehydrogenase [Actinomycetospora succinea]|uniref:Alkylation response protein AidB-like acyl-CoA dehydrogenase n=1 Tax=Actinomycetospora succinea TaxID=663603 RepID=A0A4R6VPJ2_9PSEU|nr:acyl-CoA dehydrogenase family protein [Actinomycetospora succinea]TDQ65241.1 alkylation response protein AidB-like acyl-CoA dehydrogenase [Actinomycetospora succinea]
MDFRLNDEQRLFRETLRSFVDREIVPVARDWEHEGRYPTEIVAGMRDLGLFGLAVPEEYGGLAADTVSFALTFEEISRGWMGIAGILGSHSVSCWMIARHGTEEQKQRYLPELATGERRTAIALTEPGAGTDLQSITTTAKKDGDSYIVRGTKMWITNARHADPLPVLVKTDPGATPAHRGMSMLLVEADSPGLEITKDMGKLGYKGTESCEVVLDDVRVPASQLLGGVEGRGLQQALSSLETGRINIAARSVGIAQRAYEESLAYARERSAFGQPIGDFQAVQLRLSAIAVKLQAARLMTYWAASRMDEGVRMDTESGMAKIFASDAALECATDAMRIHGGYGYSTEFEVERLYRDAPLMSIGEGTNDMLGTVVARSLLAGKASIG